MVREVPRRTLCRSVAAVGVLGLTGCSVDVSIGSDDDGSDGGSSPEDDTPTPEPLTWAEAARRVLDQSGRETLRAAGMDVATIQSKRDAREAFTVVGWHRSVEAVDSGQMEQLGTLLQRASDVRGTLSDVESILARLESLVGEMKNTDILPGRSVWDAATTLSPSLEGFDVAVTEGLDRVRTWLQLLTDVTESVGRARQAIEAVRNGQVGQYSELAGAVEQAVGAVENLESRSSDLRQRLSEFADVTGEVADIAGQLGPLADKVGTVFDEANRRLSEAASQLRQFNELLRGVRSLLAGIQSRARETRSQLLSRAATLAGGGAPANADGGTSGGRATPTPTETASTSGDVVFADDFESGRLAKWEEVVVPDRRNRDVVQWDTTEDAIAGSYSAYCDTVGDANNLRTTDPILDAGENYEISYRWRTAASNSRGIACKLTNGRDGEAFEPYLFARVGLDKDGNPRAQLNDRESFFSTLDYGRSHTTTVRIADGTVSVSLDGQQRISGPVDLSGTMHLAFDSSGHWGEESSMTLDDVRVRRL